MMRINRRSIQLASVTAAFAVAMAHWSTADADPPKSDAPSSESAGEESLDTRYARAHLELAELDLRRAKEWNKRIPNLFSQRTIESLRKHVELDREQLKQTLQDDTFDVHQIYVRGAQAAAELADADVKRKQAMFQHSPDNFNSLELERAVAVAKVAKLNLERMIARKDSIHTLSYLQWQIEELRNQLLELQVKFESSERR